jgi:hypothetical protein
MLNGGFIALFFFSHQQGYLDDEIKKAGCLADTRPFHQPLAGEGPEL